MDIVVLNTFYIEGIFRQHGSRHYITSLMSGLQLLHSLAREKLQKFHLIPIQMYVHIVHL